MHRSSREMMDMASAINVTEMVNGKHNLRAIVEGVPLPRHSHG
jgi:hypothetical protein